MAETINIAEIATDVWKRIIKWLKWESHNLTDVNWACQKKEKHNNKKTHPTDVVFYYTHPYTGKKIILNTDLKSLARSSISESSIRSALKSLAMSIECAKISSEWKNLYGLSNQNIEVSGLLFIVNHDGQFSDKKIDNFLHSIQNKSLNIAKGQKLYVLSPATINYLVNISQDIINKMVQYEYHTSPEEYNFFYPHLSWNKRHDLTNYPATIEAILSPYMILEFKNPKDLNYLIYYLENGSSIDEFIYFIDVLAAYQILNTENKIQVVFYHPVDTDVLVKFNNAKTEYAKTWYSNQRNQSLENLNAEVMETTQSVYNPISRGIRNG